MIATFTELSWGFVVIANGAIILFSLLDLFMSPRKSEVMIERNMPEEMERSISYDIHITIINNSSLSFMYEIIDGIPQSFRSSFPLRGNIKSNSSTMVTYETFALVRGLYQIEKLYLRYSSVLGLWQKHKTIEVEQSVKVIPDLTETRQYLESAQQYLLYEGNIIRKQRSGVGEFSKIRNYVVGDDPRKINWRQTAKLQEVMTNEYEPEHGKYITVLLDCGRMMGAELKKGNRLEKSLEAGLTVIAAALQKGDYVSVIAFSKNVKVYVPPAKGMAHLQLILQSIYDIQVDPFESNYGAVLNYVQATQKKRSLVLLFSDVRTFLHEESALLYLKRLRQRHLFLMIGVDDEVVTKRVQEEPTTVQKAMIKTIAQQEMMFKKREKAKWEKQGLQMVEAREDKLAITAVSYYIDIMNRGLL